MSTVVDSQSVIVETVSVNEQITTDPRYLPVFPKATALLFNSGNIVSTDRLKKRSNMNPQDEVDDVINNTLSCWLRSTDRSLVQEATSVECRHPEYHESKVKPDEKDDISVSVKLFLNSFDPQVLTQSINTILDEIGIDQLDTLILSLPDRLFNQNDLNKDLFAPLWEVMQKQIAEKRVLTSGLSDFNATYLQQVIDSLEDKNQIPALNQVNLSACCKMPEDLVAVAKINNIKLTTHVDPKEILTADSLQSVIRKHAHEYDAQNWEPLWLARYTQILKGRGIVKSKGYILSCQRELRYTK